MAEVPAAIPSATADDVWGSSRSAIFLQVLLGVAVSGAAYFLPPQVLNVVLNDWPTLDVGLYSYHSPTTSPINLLHGAQSPSSLQDSKPVELESNPLYYSPVSFDAVVNDMPPRFSPSDLEYSLGEVLSAGTGNKSLARRVIDLKSKETRDFIFEDTKVKPVIFLISSDAVRQERFVADFGDKATIVRVPRKESVGGSDGGALSHVALILTMERFGWPFICVLEDDARPAPGWYLLDRGILPLVRELYGEVGFVSLGVLSLGDLPHPRLVVAKLLYATRGALLTTGVIWGRRSIRPAHVFLRSLAEASTASDASIGPGMCAAAAVPENPNLDVLTWIPARPVVRRYEGYDDSAAVQLLQGLEALIAGAAMTQDFFVHIPVPKGL